MARETSDRIRRTCVLARMAPRQVLLVAGVAAGSLFLSDRSDAQPTTSTVATQPLVMASSRTCDGLRDLMIDTAVHQTIVGGYNPSYYGGRRHRHGRQPMGPANDRRSARKRRQRRTCTRRWSQLLRRQLRLPRLQVARVTTSAASIGPAPSSRFPPARATTRRPTTRRRASRK